MKRLVLPILNCLCLLILLFLCFIAARTLATSDTLSRTNLLGTLGLRLSPGSVELYHLADEQTPELREQRNAELPPALLQSLHEQHPLIDGD